MTTDRTDDPNATYEVRLRSMLAGVETDTLREFAVRAVGGVAVRPESERWQILDALAVDAERLVKHVKAVEKRPPSREDRKAWLHLLDGGADD